VALGGASFDTPDLLSSTSTSASCGFELCLNHEPTNLLHEPSQSSSSRFQGVGKVPKRVLRINASGKKITPLPATVLLPA
jgi:hypothetical protein